MSYTWLDSGVLRDIFPSLFACLFKLNLQVWVWDKITDYCLLAHKCLALDVDKIWDKLVPYGHKYMKNTACIVEIGKAVSDRLENC